MHELALADAIVRTACRHAAGRRVTGVGVRIGHLRQAVPSALELAFQLLAQHTDLADAALVLKQIPATGRCRDCDAETTLARFPLLCASCGSAELEILRGEELSVEWIEIEEAEGDTHEPGR
jgi:hydrogenase nickel incorporation protein HypA/HybF